MKQWFRTRRVAQLAVVAMVCLALVGLLGGRVAPAPVVVGVQGQTLWTTSLPLVWAIAVAHSLAARAQGVEVRAARRLTAFDGCLFIIACLIGCFVFAVGRHASQSPIGPVGHVLVLTGLAACVTLWFGSGAGALAVSALMIVTTIYGIRAPLGPYVRLLQPDGDPIWALAVGLTLCAGALSTVAFTQAASTQ